GAGLSHLAGVTSFSCSSSRRKPGSRVARACWLPWTPAFAGVTEEKTSLHNPYAIALPCGGGVGWGMRTGRDAFRSRPPLRGELGLHLLQQIGGLAAADAGDVVLVLQQHAEGVVDSLGIEGHLVELEKRLGPVDGLGDARQLEEVGLAQLLH